MRNRGRLRIEVRGAVQGVGFRPYVYRLAVGCGLGGWVRNARFGAEMEVEGSRGSLRQFLERLPLEVPPPGMIREIDEREIEATGEDAFGIRKSDGSGGEDPGEVVPDIATCPACLEEVFDPKDRRYLYPFTNCTHCGPRYSIVGALPYDRKNTTMRGFPMCPDCRREYKDPEDRRFHAQPNACPECGPRVSLGDLLGREAMHGAAEAIRNGEIVAVKGIGGFHLLVDARDEEAVQRLRDRKRRPDKPLAVMFPTFEAVELACEVGAVEAAFLESPAAPIVLVGKRADCALAENLAPGNPRLGVFLPYSPLHHVLMRDLGFPVVATSGNVAGEPICTRNEEAVERLGAIADQFLIHDRPIQRAVDDSVVCEMGGRGMMMRRSRGYAPAPVEVGFPMAPVLALGGDQKNTIAVSKGSQVYLSQHLGDLETVESNDAFREHLRDFPALSGIGKRSVVARDLHPGYFSGRVGSEGAVRQVGIQHHHAHLAACLAENGIEEDVLGVVWDGTGYGTDGTIWGGEFLVGGLDGFERFDALRSFPLPGGEKAIREPRFAAVGLLHEAGIDVRATPLAESFTKGELGLVEKMLERRLNAPTTTSAGRLFDGVAALLGLRGQVNFEGQAAMELEFIASGEADVGEYDVAGATTDWEPVLRAILSDLGDGVEAGVISARFHRAMAGMILGVARRAGRSRVALSGGCFQNRYLTERVILVLKENGFEPVWHRQVPPNDGGLSLGQAVIAGRGALESK